MSFHRKTPSLFAVLNRGRAVALCGVAATAIAVPTIAFAATSGSPAPAGVHAAAQQTSAKPSASATKPASATPSATASASASETKPSAPATKASTPTAKTSTKATSSETEAKQASSDSSSSNSGSSNSGSSNSDSSSSSGSSSSNSSSSSVSSSNYADDLDGWINEAIAVMNANGVSAPSYNAIYQTAMNESSGNPSAENGWDSNAASGTPSIGLMQMVQSTFDAYALSGHGDIWNPVDNIIAASQYANATYGGLDSVVSARCGGSCWYGY